jgi:hypothetical protein
MQQFNKLIEFRQAVYEYGLTRAQDAQFELVDALLLSPSIRSFPELSLSPAFRRKWSSAYVAIEDGRQDWRWLSKHFVSHIPETGDQVFALDGTAWPHPQARTLEDRQYVYSPTQRVNGGSVVIGHVYSVLGWVPEPSQSWAPPLSVRRVTSRQTAVKVGVAQVKQLCQLRREIMLKCFYLITADGKYGNHRFLAPLKDEPCGILVRLRCDRVLYRAPGVYGGCGRPRKHGQRFSFKDATTWGRPDAEVEFDDERWGQVRLRRWDNLHARQDASTPFSVILAQVHRERDKPPAPLWLGYQPPYHQRPDTQPLQALWRGYTYRWPVEPNIRFRKQYLYWTLPRFQTATGCDRWTWLVSIAQWELFLARDWVCDRPLPWQPAQTKLTPERTRQGLGALFQQIGTPATAPQSRGKSPGWPTGKARTRPKRHQVVKKTKKKPKST